MTLDRLNCAYCGLGAEGGKPQPLYRLRSPGFSSLVDRPIEDVFAAARCRIGATREIEGVGTVTGGHMNPGSPTRGDETMTMEIEVKASEMVQRHLNRNPRVTSYSGSEVFTVQYDNCTPISRSIAAEARQLGLDELGRRPFDR
jgi:hypothetical protein